jgi:thymidylate synthase (FAD)
MMTISDRYFKTTILRATQLPQQLCWLAAHQDYSSESLIDYIERGGFVPNEDRAGEYLVKNCLRFGHYGVLEHSQITFNCAGFPHSVIVQARTHRIGVSFDCQSQRYTSEAVIAFVEGRKPIEEVFYFRPVDDYVDRQGHRYHYYVDDLIEDIEKTTKEAKNYVDRLNKGFSQEHARDFLPQNIRQHFVASFNARSLMHFLDLRSKADAQIEIVTLSNMLFGLFEKWMPETAAYYREARLSRAKLAP